MFKSLADLIFYVILQDNLIKGNCGIIEGSSSLYISTMASLVPIWTVVVDT